VIKKVDLYLLRHFSIALIVVAIAIGATIMVINMIESVSRFIDNEIPIIEIAEYYLYFAGWVLKNFLPMFVLLACLFSISILARRNEILALKVSGRSLYRIALPILVVSVLLSGLHFYYSEYIYPPLGKRIIEIQRFTIENRSKRSFTRTSNITRQIHPGHIYTLASFDVSFGEGGTQTDSDRIPTHLVGSPLVGRRWRVANLRRFQGRDVSGVRYSLNRGNRG